MLAALPGYPGPLRTRVTMGFILRIPPLGIMEGMCEVEAGFDGQMNIITVMPQSLWI